MTKQLWSNERIAKMVTGRRWYASIEDDIARECALMQKVRDDYEHRIAELEAQLQQANDAICAMENRQNRRIAKLVEQLAQTEKGIDES